MAQIFPIDFEEKTTMAQDDYILFSDSEDGNKIKKAQYSNLKGEQGNPGTAATITVGSTTTGAAGSSASVTNSGTTSAAVLDFTIPEGEKGDPGDTGAYVTSAAFNGNDIDFGLSDGTTVTLEDAKVDLKGDPGDDATISVGTTTTGNPGTNASVTNSGTSSAAVFNFTIPKGDTGATGSAATISVGTTSTLSPGSSATVKNSGTSSAAVFDFGIPQGATGATGNGIASVTSSKSGKITTVTITETDGDSSSFTVSDGADGEGAGDVVGPASSTDGDIVLFDGVTGKIIKDGSKALSDLVQTSGNQTINGTKTYTTSPVVPNKTSTATNTGTAIATEAQVYTVADAVSTINGKISSNASSSNKLMDKTYIDDAINSVTAYYITKNAQGDQWATYAELAAATTFYSGGVVRVPTRNDYTIVLADENHDNATTRYSYQNNQWEYQYTVNETALTQAQLDALNSGITSGKVSTYDGYATTISGKQDALTLPNSPTQGNLVTWGADKKTLVDGGTVPTGFSPDSTGTTGQYLKKTAGGYDWADVSGGDVLVSSQANNILTSGMKIWAGTQANYEALGTYDNNCLYLTI